MFGGDGKDAVFDLDVDMFRADARELDINGGGVVCGVGAVAGAHASRGGGRLASHREQGTHMRV